MNQEITTNPFNPLASPKMFDEIKVSLASPERILSWSYGEIKSQRPSTIVRSNQNVMAYSVLYLWPNQRLRMSVRKI